MQLRDKISLAKAKLLVDYPLFGTIASKLKLIQNDDIQAFKSDGTTLEYNSDFFTEISLAEMEFTFANGAMHASLSHESRKNGRSGWLWQLATDYAVNDMLVENGLERPYQAHYSKRFCGLYAEEIYAELKETLTEISDDVSQMQDAKEEQSSSYNITQVQKDSSLEEQLFEEFAQSVLDAENKRADLPTSIGRFFNIEKEGKIDWRDELKSAIERFHKDDYTQMPANKKFLHLGFYLPSSISNRFKLVVAVDSSGSIDEDLLSEFLSELNFLMNTIPSYEINLLVCDDKIRSNTTFYSGDILEVHVEGGGATDFRPVFELIENELLDTKLLLYFSDLDGTFPTIEPSYEVKWITPIKQDVPFGEVIVLPQFN
ncbi:VWA-like domain-containing protein [Sulfurimonas sp.]|uniref:vWA domain-containing protein n=1 Tax=Sulfurimonas sp. TaxID=2022749 RepID=UPI0025D81720|nr:VWA-like domain-containing protein [Sulfurimonas sp.]